MSDPTVEIRKAPEDNRFEILVDGERAGLAAYRDRGSQRVFHHTEVAPEYGGRGLATQLVSRALATTIGEGMRIVPVCPLVAKYVRTHEELAADADPATGDVLAWLEDELG
ncbi:MULTISPECIES: GNAT family N-acetyltransferase [Brevibacterium]|jgi:predicted GNAT family acetyltransferase|uniref:N-acetyltransferase n=1 Tax=Brevibacterium salitolerans TaxID=1403566 RepID=A0ABN2WSZ4_9MICO|nr:GNAT family N-acetyltransferase [Brevibacterium sp.]